MVKDVVAIIHPKKDDNINDITSAAGESSDSDATINSKHESDDSNLTVVSEINSADEDDDTSDEFAMNLNKNKRKHVSDSSDEEPESKVSRRHKIDTDTDRSDTDNRDSDSDSNNTDSSDTDRSDTDSSNEHDDGLTRSRKKILTKTRKRKRVTDSSDDEREFKLQKIQNRNPKRRHYSYSSDEKQAEKISKFTVNKESRVRANGICKLMEADVKTQERRVERRNYRISKLQKMLKKERSRVKLYSKQLDSIKDRSSGLSPIEEILNNKVSLEQINQVRLLLKSGNLQPILDDDDLVLTIQHLFMGLLEGIIPIASPQSLVLTDEHTNYMRAIEKMGISESATYLLNNPRPLIEIFVILDKSLKLMVKTYQQFIAPIID